MWPNSKLESEVIIKDLTCSFLSRPQSHVKRQELSYHIHQKRWTTSGRGIQADRSLEEEQAQDVSYKKLTFFKTSQQKRNQLQNSGNQFLLLKIVLWYWRGVNFEYSSGRKKEKSNLNYLSGQSGMFIYKCIFCDTYLFSC